MKSIDELFGDAVMGYSAKEPQLGGYSGSLAGAGERVTSSILPGMESDLSRMTGGARRRRSNRKTQRGGGDKTVSHTTDNPEHLWPVAKKLWEEGDEENEEEEEAVIIDKIGTPPVGNAQRGVPTTPVGLGIFGNVGQKPGEQKQAPYAPIKKKLQFGGGRRSRKSRKMRKSRKTQHGGRRRTTTKQGRKSFLNLRISGQIRMKQRHRQ